MARTRVLVVSSEPVGEAMAGPAIRALELARALAAECEVTLAAPAPSTVADGRIRLLEAGFVDYDALRAAARDHDVLVAQLLPPRLLARLAREPVRIVADLYDPTPVEVLELVRDLPLARARLLQRIVARSALAHLAAADLVLCASEPQRDLWLGALATLGLLDLEEYRADPTARSRVAVVPFGLPVDPPEPGPAMKGVWPGIGAGDRVILWNGGVWNWLDAETPIRAAAALPDGVHLCFLGLGRPAMDVQDRHGAAERAVALASELGIEGVKVHFNPGWVPYAERGRYLLDADLAVTAHLEHLEARFAFRTRLLDCLWAGLPVVATRGDVLAERVAAAGAGTTVPPGDPDALARAWAHLLGDGERRLEASRAARALAPAFTWERVAAPLVEWCATVSERPERRRPRGVLRAATLAQYPLLARQTAGRDGLAAAAGRVARNAGRAVRRR